MRKVTAKIRAAFIRGHSLSVGNTTTNGESVFLHGNEILYKSKDGAKVYGSMAGWNTPTTRERLNGITQDRWTQKDFEPFFNGDPIGENQWKETSL